MATSTNKNTLKIVSWNVNGIRACLTKGMLESIGNLNPDILCLQEIKADNEVMQKLAELHFPEYQLFNSSAVKKGYSGVATLIRKSRVQSVLAHDSILKLNLAEGENSQIDKELNFFAEEGRFSIIKTQLFKLYNLYIPSGTSGESRQSLKYIFLEHLLAHLKEPNNQNSALILTGDFNICHKAIDIHHPKEAEQRKLTGFLPEERAWMDKLVKIGFKDCFRSCQGELKKAYTWWSYRAQARPKNLGWRIDYFFCSEPIASKCSNAQIHAEIAGSDHCPISVEFNFE